MITLDMLYEKIDIGEEVDIEFKSAKGGLPKSLWETLSAFANTVGGYIILGIEEVKGGTFELGSLGNPKGVLKVFWDTHNNPQKLSTPVCKEEDVVLISVENSTVMLIRVPETTRMQRPVYLNGNPFGGTYKRNYEGDYKCAKFEIKQMLRDASNDAQDADIVEGFSMGDIDIETLNAYRNRFRSRLSDHPYLALSDIDLLKQLGAYRRDRKSGEEGLTSAGLLMFGKESSIMEAFPHFHLDYREKMSDNPDERWSYRITQDGTWECNLHNFYFRVYNRLIRDIEVPFALDHEGVRIGETHVHEAIREVLANMLVHADHKATKSNVIIKERESMLFTNPGRLRITVAQLYQGGVSDPRNPNIQKMFQFLGLGDKAGSGFLKILRAWKEQEWFKPLVYEKYDAELTVVMLPMLSMVPEHVNRELEGILGQEYQNTDELQRLILILAHQFSTISNSEIGIYSDKHPHDIGEELKHMVKKGWLVSEGSGRGMRYRLIRHENLEDTLGGQAGGQAEILGGQVGGQAKKSADKVEQILAEESQVTVTEWQILSALTEGAKSSKELREEELKTHPLSGAFKERLSSLRERGLIAYTIPDKPKSPKQSYRLTKLGKVVLMHNVKRTT